MGQIVSFSDLDAWNAAMDLTVDQSYGLAADFRATSNTGSSRKCAVLPFQFPRISLKDTRTGLVSDTAITSESHSGPWRSSKLNSRSPCD